MKDKAKMVLLCTFLSTSIGLAQDKFAEIGTQTYQTREHLLVRPKAPELPEIHLPLKHNRASIFKAQSPISTKEELYKELAQMRERYSPFLGDLAPKVKEMRQRVYLKSFYWRVETPEDVKDFSALAEGGGA